MLEIIAVPGSWKLFCRMLTISAFCSVLNADDKQIDYSRDVRPILAVNCFRCHGADEGHREAMLRLDTFSGATQVNDDHAAVVPGSPDKSELIARITTDNPEHQMPPAETGQKLNDEQIKILKTWIAEGAEYKQHWALSAPKRPDVPALTSDWIRNPIDAFVLKELQKNRLSPAPAADSATLLRRLSLDLTGLPPAMADIKAFNDRLNSRRTADITANASADVLKKTVGEEVERLLASSHFGEKWARHWLDAARYADSDGFEKDKPRFVWFYRDWVVKAMNTDKPYNEFLIEQIAGDLLPDRTQDQLIATGFLRNSMINEEGGVDPEQFRMEAMFDRMDAVGKAMLGLTIQCTQCHDHKYDPLTQSDYYRMFAFLNNSDEAQATVYTDAEQKQRSALLSEIRETERRLQADRPGWADEVHAWAQQLSAHSPDWQIVRPQLDASGGQKHYLLEDGSVLAQGYAPTKHTTDFVVETNLTSLSGFRLELLNDPNLPHGGPGRSVDGLCALSEFQILAAPIGSDSRMSAVRLTAASADVNPPEQELAALYADKSKERRTTGPVTFAIDGNNSTAWGIDVGGGRSNVPRNAVFTPDSPLISQTGFRLTFRLIQMHGGWNSDDNQNNNPGRFRFSVTSQPEPAADPVPPSVRAIAAMSPDDRSEQQRRELFSHWRTTVPEFSQANEEIERLWNSHPRGTTQLVLQERSNRRPTWILTRGDFLKPAEMVEPGVPQVFGSLTDSGNTPDRLKFARWIADKETPTTARNAVNRIWQEYFGVGIVQTAEDFGTQGEYPSHPELLDWLAVELIENQWSQKHIHRLIVNSATYQQSSRVSPEQFAADPQNRLLSRGSRFRVSGESVRDIFLSASGLLNPTVGGPGVYPPAPEFLFLPPASYGPKTWNVVSDQSRFRRAIYTFRFRSVPYPVLETFDTPRGDTACARRNRSNTPLQALTTLNEELFMDCARALAVAALRDRQASDTDRVDFLMLQCVSRNASAEERDILLSFFGNQKQRFQGSEFADEEKLRELCAAGPDQNPHIQIGTSLADLAAWTATARVVLNMDETITKE